MRRSTPFIRFWASPTSIVQQKTGCHSEESATKSLFADQNGCHSEHRALRGVKSLPVCQNDLDKHRVLPSAGFGSSSASGPHGMTRNKALQFGCRARNANPTLFTFGGLRLALFAATVLLLAMHCTTHDNLAGNASEVENSIVAGKILNQDGSAALNTQVKVYPSSYNPVHDSATLVPADTTNAQGQYSVSGIMPGNHTLEAIHVEERTKCWVADIDVSEKTTVQVPDDTLRQTGSIKISLYRESDSANGYIYIPGTSAHVELSHLAAESAFVVIDSVPEGTIDELVYSERSDTSVSVSFVKNQTVTAESTTNCEWVVHYGVARMSNPPTIDGLLDEYTSGTPITITDPIDGTSCEFRILWDQDFFYLATRVSDSNLLTVPKYSGELYFSLHDGIEIMFDPLGNRGDLVNSDDTKYFVNAHGERADTKGLDSTWESSFLSAVVVQGTVDDTSDVDTGYTVEMAIPWSDMNLSPMAGDTVVFDFVLNNHFSVLEADFSQTPWANTTPLSSSTPINVPRGWGILVLK